MILAFIQGIGPLELTIVLVILLLILGPKRLPGLGRSIGSGMREFKESITSRHADADAEDEDAARRGEMAALARPSSQPRPAEARVVVVDEQTHEGEAVPERR
jgi:sec-independent protein translocase protein TatA